MAAKGPNQARFNFLIFWFDGAKGIFVFQFVGFGIVRILLGGSLEEWRQHIDILSMPLSLIDRNFQLTPANSFFDLCGVLVGNSFFYALFIYLCYQPVRRAFRRNRPTRLSISDTDSANVDSAHDDWPNVDWPNYGPTVLKSKSWRDPGKRDHCKW